MGSDPDQAGWHRPVPLTPEHVVEGFCCGDPDLDDFILRRARANQASGATETHVVIARGRVVGYYSLVSGAAGRKHLPTARDRRNMPEPVPVVVLGRLAVDQKHAGRGLGRELVRQAIATTAVAARASAWRASSCAPSRNASPSTRTSYTHFGFRV